MAKIMYREPQWVEKKSHHVSISQDEMLNAAADAAAVEMTKASETHKE